MRSLPVPPAWSGPLPAATPPDDLTIHQLPTGTYETRAALAVKGGSFRDRRHFAATAVLIRHPGGDLLLDAGFGAHVAEHVAMLPRIARAPYQASHTVSEQLDAAGYDRDRLLGVVLTHSHWDHVSGLDQLRVPVWMNDEEVRYAAQDTDGAVFRAVSPGLDTRRYAFDGPPHLGFPASHDVHGDGSVVIAFAGGHTSGSVVVFVTLPTGACYGFIGDITWQLDGIRRRVERPRLLSRLADSNADQVRQGLLHAIALTSVVHIVPAHDLDAYTGIPVLPARLSDGSPAAGR